MRRLLPAIAFVLICHAVPDLAAQPSARKLYRVTQVAAGAVYLDGGADDGVTEGMRFKVTRRATGEAQMSSREIGEITVIAVAAISAACTPAAADLGIQVDDIAELSPEDALAVELRRASKSARHVAQTVAFTEGDPIEQELREYVPRPPSPEVNRMRGRISFGEDALLDHASGTVTLQESLVVRADLTRIRGSYWNFTGYWQGRLTSRSGAASTSTLQDLLNRTYQIGLSYNNPKSRYVAGAGRFLLPWAPGLNTIDGAYFARRLGKRHTAGLFAGSTPNPAAWNYDPNRQMAGAFLAYEAGSYSATHFSSVAGVAVTRSHWHPERQFLFLENTLILGARFSVYHNMEIDRLAPALTSNGQTPVRLARSFLTVRAALTKRLAVDLSHNYFRDVPTFDTRLLGAGLLDQFLFQGFSGGLKLTVGSGATLYGSAGGSKRESDPKASLNYMGGLTLTRLPFLVRADLRFTRFNSSFGSGEYKSATLSRQLGERIHFEVQGGTQSLKSSFTNQTRTAYGMASLDYLIGRHYMLGVGWTSYRGKTQNYDQSFINFGYRF